MMTVSRKMTAQRTRRNSHRRFSYAQKFFTFVFFLTASVFRLHGSEPADLDGHTVRFDGFWFYSQPLGSFHGTGSQGRLELQKDLGFNSYDTGTLRAEWKFTRKNHLYVGYIPVRASKEVVLSRTVVFEGQTFDVGLATRGLLETFFITPGYQYDIIRRKQGHLGIAVQLDLIYIRGSLNAAAQTVNGTQHFAQVASSTIRAPLPVAGPDFRYYLIPNSSRLFVSGNVFGMYFFGYGNFISSYGTIGLSLNQHLNLQGGYQLGSRFNINTKSNRVGLNLTQRGVVAGIEASF